MKAYTDVSTPSAPCDMISFHPPEPIHLNLSRTPKLGKLKLVIYDRGFEPRRKSCSWGMTCALHVPPTLLGNSFVVARYILHKHDRLWIQHLSMWSQCGRSSRVPRNLLRTVLEPLGACLLRPDDATAPAKSVKWAVGGCRGKTDESDENSNNLSRCGQANSIYRVAAKTH